MEKRRQARTAVALEVELVYAGRATGNYRTRNLSLGGVFLSGGDGSGPPVGAEVGLNFRTHAASERRHAMQARVARVEPAGIALIFREFNLDDFSFLQGALEGR